MNEITGNKQWMSLIFANEAMVLNVIFFIIDILMSHNPQKIHPNVQVFND